MSPDQPKEGSPLLYNEDKSDFDDCEQKCWSSKLERIQNTVSARRWALAFSVSFVLAALVQLLRKPLSTQTTSKPSTSVAFLGNSMIYFNDFPRFLVEFASSKHTVVQNSCLRGGASIYSLVREGNGMYPKFRTRNSVVGTVLLPNGTSHTVYDYGACSPRQLLTGSDDRLNDPGYLSPLDPHDTANQNPCRHDYIDKVYAERVFYDMVAHRPRPLWDYVVINDFTRNPVLWRLKQHSLHVLEQVYVPLLLETGSIPILMCTHAYEVASTPERNMTGLESVANFTSLVYAGYMDYANLLSTRLPASQQPRIAPVGLAFLAVYEDNYTQWQRLFHSDHIHPSPSGTFLQACVVYFTIFGQMPDENHVVRDNMGALWATARMMQHAKDQPNPMIDRGTAHYLYRVAERVMVHGYKPQGFVNYQHGG